MPRLRPTAVEYAKVNLDPAAGAGALEVGDLQIGILSDVYLSGVRVASLDRVAAMARALGEPAVSDSALAIRAKALKTMESKLWMAGLKQYACALLKDGSVNGKLRVPREEARWRAKGDGHVARDRRQRGRLHRPHGHVRQ